MEKHSNKLTQKLSCVFIDSDLKKAYEADKITKCKQNIKMLIKLDLNNINNINVIISALNNNLNTTFEMYQVETTQTDINQFDINMLDAPLNYSKGSLIDSICVDNLTANESKELCFDISKALQNTTNKCLYFIVENNSTVDFILHSVNAYSLNTNANSLSIMSTSAPNSLYYTSIYKDLYTMDTGLTGCISYDAVGRKMYYELFTTTTNSSKVPITLSANYNIDNPSSTLGNNVNFNFEYTIYEDIIDGVNAIVTIDYQHNKSTYVKTLTSEIIDKFTPAENASEIFLNRLNYSYFIRYSAGYYVLYDQDANRINFSSYRISSIKYKTGEIINYFWGNNKVSRITSSDNAIINITYKNNLVDEIDIVKEKRKLAFSYSSSKISNISYYTYDNQTESNYIVASINYIYNGTTPAGAIDNESTEGCSFGFLSNGFLMNKIINNTIRESIKCVVEPNYTVITDTLGKETYKYYDSYSRVKTIIEPNSNVTDYTYSNPDNYYLYDVLNIACYNTKNNRNINNYDFSQIQNNLPAAFTFTNTTANDGIVTISPAERVLYNQCIDNKAVLFTQSTAIKTMMQEVSINGNPKDIITFSCFNKLDTNNNAFYRLKLTIYYIDGTSNIFEKNINFQTISVYQTASISIAARLKYSKVKIEIMYADVVNSNIEALYITGLGLYINSSNTTIYNYHENKKLKDIDVLSNSIKLDYNTNSQTITLENGEVFTCIYNSDKTIQKLTNSLGHSIQYEYDNLKNITVTTQSFSGSNNKIVTEYFYDGLGNIIEVVNDSAHSTNKSSTMYSYDYSGNVTAINYANGLAVNYNYDNNKKLTSQYVDLGSSVATISYEYDSKGLLKTVTTATGSKYKYIYDTLNRLTDVLLDDNTLVTYKYENTINGINTDSITKKIYKDNSNLYIFNYNEYNQPTTVEYNNVTKATFSYDNKKRLSTVIDHANNITKTYTYNDLDAISNYSDNLGNEYTYTYDNLGNVQRKVIAQPNTLTKSYDYDYMYEYNTDIKAIGVSYCNRPCYDGFELFTLNGNLSSVNGKNPQIYHKQETSTNTKGFNYFAYDPSTSRRVYSSSLTSDARPNLFYATGMAFTGTASIRFKPISASSTNRYILQFHELRKETYGTFIRTNIAVYINSSGRLFVKTLAQDEDTGINVSNNYWYHLAIRLSSGTGKLFVGYSTYSFTYPTAVLSTVSLGCNTLNASSTDSYSENHLNGYMELFAFSSTNASDAVINDIINNNNITSSKKCYDKFDRIDKQHIVTNNNTNLVTQYKYTDALGKVDSLPQYITLPNGNSIIYTYDKANNITSKIITTKDTSSTGNNNISESYHYEYDVLNRLVCERHQNANNQTDYTYCYTYDTNGNILTKAKRDFTSDNVLYTDTYNYSTTIKDRLLTVVRTKDGQTTTIYNYTYNLPFAFNPSSITTNNNTYNLLWEGRRLIQYGNYQYTYNEQGVRIKKVVNGITTTFTVEGSKIIHSKENQTDMYYNYDEAGLLISFNLNNEEYFYIRDLEGNIVNVIDKDGTVLVKYSYTAYGVVTQNAVSELSSAKQVIANNILAYNHFVYKGYYYDVETGLYYLTSRYYDPEIGRFISADDISYLDPSSIGGLNLYSYCNNNPIMMYDPNGNFAISAIIIGALLGFAFAYVPDVIKNFDDGFDLSDFNTFEDNWRKYLGATVSGAFAGLGGNFATTMLFSGIGDVLGGIINGSVTNFNDACITFGLSMVLSGIGYGISYGISKGLSNAKLDKIVGNWNADNRIINNKLRDAGLPMLKIGKIGKKGIQDYFFKHGGFNRITYAVIKDIINYSYDFVTEQIF